MNIPFVSRFMRLPAIQRQSTLSLIFTLAITGIGFLSTMLFSHVLGKDLMGVYYLFIAYFGIFNMIGDGGFGQAAVKRISERAEQSTWSLHLQSAFALSRLIHELKYSGN